MIDFVKILVTGISSIDLEKNPYLDFYDKINLDTGEIRTVNRYGKKTTPYKNAFYNGLEFRIYDTGTITIQGSLHKYWNAGAHNYNDFDFKAFLSVLIDFQIKFNIDSGNCILRCLEVGININPIIETNEIIESCLLHKTKPFEYQKNSFEGKYKQVVHSQYIVKLYNKALQYNSKGFNISNKIMRFEIKYTKMEKLKKLGIGTLKDICKIKVQAFKNELLNEWQNILFFDNTTQIDTLCKNSQKEALLKYSNPIFWTGLVENKQNENFKYHKKQMQKIIFSNSKNIKEATAEIMSKKIDFLIDNTTQIDTLIIASKKVVSNLENEFQKDCVCKVTGINISMQKKGSSLLSHTGLKYYFQNDKKVFEQIKRRYLSNRWHKSNFEKQIKEIAHNIRNTNSNQKIKQNRLYPKEQLNINFNFL